MAKPFHESIVDLIQQVNTTLGDNSKPLVLGVLATLIEQTIIPKNHDTITKTLRDAAKGTGPQSYVHPAIIHLAQEKERCEQQAREKTEQK